MTTVIIAQALFLQDGGLAALGANIFNIAALPVVTGYGVFQITGGGRSQGKGLAVRGFLSGWVSVVVSAVACAFQLALSGVISLKVGLPAMAGYHAVIGIGEGALTAGVLVFLSHARPDLLSGNLDARLRPLDWLAALAFVAFPCTILILAGTSDLPDPLQRLLVSAAPVSKPEADSEQLLSPSRYREYFWMIAVLSAAFAIVWVAARLGRRGSRNP